jgi:hypothetical protein
MAEERRTAFSELRLNTIAAVVALATVAALAVAAHLCGCLLVR